jgi:hypothetical protein
MENVPIGPILDTVGKKITSDVYETAKKWLTSFDPTGAKLDDYHAGLADALGYIQIMGMTSPRRLENIYVGLRASPELRKFTRRVPRDYRSKPERAIVEARKFIYSRERFNMDQFIDDLGFAISDEDEYDEAERELAEMEKLTVARIAHKIGQSEVHHSHVRAIRAIDLVEKYKKLIVLGHPGSGKTTLLKYLALVYSGHLSVPVTINFLLPIFVPLREVKRVGPPVPTAEWLRDLAVSCAGDVSTKAFGKEWLEATLDKGRCIILLTEWMRFL